MSAPEERGVDVVIAEADDAVRQGEYRRAVDVLQAGLPTDPDNLQLLIRLGQAARLVGDLAESLRVLRRAAELDPDYFDVLYQLGVTLRDESDIWGALAQHTRMVELYPHNRAGRFVLAMDNTLLGRPDLALPEVEAVLVADPDRPFYRLGHGAILNRLGRHTEAIGVLRAVLDEGYLLVDAWLELAEAYRGLQQTAAWVEAVRGGKALDADHPAVQVWLYDVALVEGRPQEGPSHLQRALELHPRFFRAHIGIGTFAWNAGDLDAAEAWLESAVQIAPWDGRAQGVLAQFRAETGRGQLDLERLETEALAMPYGRLPFYLGQLHLQARGDAERAARFLGVAVDHAPEDVQGRTLLGDALIARQEYERAATHFERATALSPEFGPAWAGLAFVRMRQGNLTEAAEAYARAAALLPRQANVRQGFGVTLLDLGREEEGLPELRAAAELEPENGKVLFSLARGLDRAGQRDEALETARRARALLPDDQQIAELAGRLEAQTAEASHPEAPRAESGLPEAGGETSDAPHENGQNQGREDQRR